MTNLKEKSSTTDDALGLHSLFNPRSIAVVGASHPQAGVGGFGASFLRALKEMRFPGPIYPVNPKYEEIEGLKCYPSLREIQDPRRLRHRRRPTPISFRTLSKTALLPG